MSITSYKNFSVRNLAFGRLQPRGMYHFSNILYKGEPLIIETPPLITPNGINADEARNWMDVDLNISNDPNHQALYNMFKSIDDRCINECINNRSRWFPRHVDDAFIEEEYKSPLTAGWGNEPASLRIEIVPERPEDLVDNNGVPLSPEDVSALSSVVIQMQLLGVWASEKYLGCHWRALVVRANLDHETQGRRRSDSPRRISPPPTRPPRALASRSEPNVELKEVKEAPKDAPKEAQKEAPKEAPKDLKELREAPKEAPKDSKVEQKEPVAQRDTKARVQEMLKRFQAQRETERQYRHRQERDERDEREDQEEHRQDSGEEIDEEELERRLIEDEQRERREREYRHRYGGREREERSRYRY